MLRLIALRIADEERHARAQQRQKDSQHTPAGGIERLTQQQWKLEGAGCICSVAAWQRIAALADRRSESGICSMAVYIRCTGKHAAGPAQCHPWPRESVAAGLQGPREVLLLLL